MFFIARMIDKPCVTPVHIHFMNTYHFFAKWPFVISLLGSIASLGAQINPDMPALRFSLSVKGNVGVPCLYYDSCDSLMDND